MKSLKAGLATAAVFALFAGGCDSSIDRRVGELERQVAQLQKENRELKSKLASSKPSGDASKGASTVSTYHADWKGVPLEESASRGLKWLVSVQGTDGGWGQDGGHTGDARPDVSLESQGNDVANTAMVCLALLRAGTTTRDGEYRDALNRGIAFILSHVEAAPEEGLQITKRTGTQIQRKLGPNIDTFLANLLLSEIDGVMPDAVANAKARAALNKCVAKIEKNQQADGSWNVGGGWAPIIGTSMASRGLYNAQQKGAPVDAPTLARVQSYSEKNFNHATGEFDAKDGAGVQLYAAAQSLENNSRSGADREKFTVMNSAAKAKLAEGSFLSGFGSMGGEEFVSYMNISDSMVRSGGKEWGDWNGKIKDHLVKLQNQDGTWAGHHCITGRVACTSAAVMTLLTERGVARVQ